MLILEYVFTLTAWEMVMTTSHQRNILKIQKPGEIFIFYKNCLFLSKYLKSFSWPSPFKSTKTTYSYLSSILFVITWQRDKKSLDSSGSQSEQQYAKIFQDFI
jgi:hypothetical protein